MNGRKEKINNVLKSFRIADPEEITDAVLAVLREREQEPVAYLYEYVSPMDGKTFVWRTVNGEWNGQQAKSSKPLYAEPVPQAEFVAPEGYKLLKDTAPAEREWREDAAHENGQYYNTCGHCGRLFVGHKRRVVCKACADPA